MQNNDEKLSQNEIDAMLAGGAEPAVAEPEPAAAEPPPAMAEPPPVVAPPPVVQTVQSFPASPPPGAPPSGFSPGGDTGQLQQQVQELTAQLQELAGKVDSIVSGLQATVGFNAQGTFTCNSCTAHGQVAARLTCTACGTEDWWGWFPPQQ